jgi:hypothetical protein
MTAAAQCPKCGHGFELRDGFGELLPLAYCSSCASYYRASLGECRWCGTKPERAPIGPHVWKGIGAAALVALVGTAWLLRSAEPPDTTSIRAKAAMKSHSAPLPRDTTAQTPTTAIDDTVASPTMIASADTITRDSVVPATTPGEVTTATTPRELPAASKTPATTPAIRASAASKPAVQSMTSAAPASAKSRRSARWVSSISRDWVVVRADASKRSRLVASIGPNSRVQLGESRGDWRRIRAKGLAGWVEQRAEFRVATR